MQAAAGGLHRSLIEMLDCHSVHREWQWIPRVRSGRPAMRCLHCARIKSNQIRVYFRHVNIATYNTYTHQERQGDIDMNKKIHNIRMTQCLLKHLLIVW